MNNVQFISLKKIPSQNFNIVLDGKNCNISFICWNGYTYNWLTIDDIVVNAGVICHCNVNFNQFKHKSVKGSLVFLNNTSDGTQPYYDSFNEKYKLIYIGA